LVLSGEHVAEKGYGSCHHHGVTAITAVRLRVIDAGRPGYLKSELTVDDVTTCTNWSS
jgi:hypothetical protein